MSTLQRHSLREKQDNYDTPRGGWKLVISDVREVAISAM